MWSVFILAFCLTSFINTRTVPENNTAILISKYAKVAHWGATDNMTKSDNIERRSGQSLWTHRSDVNLVTGQNVISDKPKVTYHYAVYKKPSQKIDNEKVERFPAIGEVIEDRYNPRPYFKYGKIPLKSEESATYGPPKPTPPSTSNFGFGSFPSFNDVSSTPKPLELYTSPYNSYNPPAVMSDISPVTGIYPPSGQDHYTAPQPSDDPDIYSYNHKVPQNPPTISYTSLGPPLSPEYMSDSGEYSGTSNDHNGHDISMNHDNEHPPYPPKSEDDIYYPTDSNGGGHNHSPKGVMPPPPDMSKDLAPTNHGRFPQYLYDSYHFDHHVYEEVPHTTTEAAEDKRVSSGHYSYSYLGRKLWYVPLYFSIYFIIYVTVLILKAIARHKVQNKQKWITHTRNSRKLDSNENNYIEDATRNVTNAVDKAGKIYAYAM